MKLAMIALAALALGACSRESPSLLDPTPDSGISGPTPPPADPATSGWIWAMAVGKDGGCIPGATFTVVSGQSYVGEVITQQTPCGVWDYGDVGIMLRGLTPGVAMTLRASAAGYWTVERTVLTQSSGSSEIFALHSRAVAYLESLPLPSPSSATGSSYQVVGSLVPRCWASQSSLTFPTLTSDSFRLNNRRRTIATSPREPVHRTSFSA
jgi:hypothetical protein